MLRSAAAEASDDIDRRHAVRHVRRRSSSADRDLPDAGWRSAPGDCLRTDRRRAADRAGRHPPPTSGVFGRAGAGRVGPSDTWRRSLSRGVGRSFARRPMTVEEEVLARIVEILERVDVPYMVTGSIAASYHGRPRATHDADVVIDPAPQHAEALIAALEGAGFYVNTAGARRAIRDRSQFNAIEMARAAKVDLIVRKARPFSIEEF